MDGCLFCKIANGEIPSSKVYEDDQVTAFRDIDPKAPVHVLIVPKKHCANILEADEETVAALFGAAKKLAHELNVEESGFRLVINTGRDGGQSVPHLHMHLLGARSLAWPPG
jgi:histidine triad (HIT) family protein